MNYRILTSVALLAAIAVALFGWRQHRQINELEERRQRASRQLAALGVDSGQSSDAAGPKTHRRQENPGGAHTLTSALEAYEKLTEAGEAGPARQELRTHLWNLSPGEAGAFLREMVARSKVPEEKGFANFASGIAAKSVLSRYPTQGLDICLSLIENGAEPSRSMIGREANRFLLKWVREQPEQALDWMLPKMPSEGGKISQDARWYLAKEIASLDRKRLLAVASDLQLTPRVAAELAILGFKDEADRLAAIDEVRDYLSSIEDDQLQGETRFYAFSALGRRLCEGGFDSGSRWAESAGLHQGELMALGSDMGVAVRAGEEGKWINWLTSHVKGEDYRRPVRSIIQSWTRSDYNGCGRWLRSQPPGPARDYAAGVFATTIASYEPEAAVTWADTLPEGQLRREVLREISHRWPRESPEQAEAARKFKEQYGIEP